MNLSFFIIIPFITTILILLTPKEKNKIIKWIALIGTSFLLIYSFILIFKYYNLVNIFDNGSSSTELLFQQKISWFSSMGINYFVGVDGISILMLFMTSIVIFTGVLASWNVVNRNKEFFSLLLILVTGVYGVFISFDLFTFFIFYELAVLPMYLLIGIWGTGKKEYAAMKLTLMLMASSALILVAFLAIYHESPIKTFDLTTLIHVKFATDFQYWIFPTLFIGFGVLGAIYPFHTWSPDGHASAPTAVSMLHAGVLMKLGGYGVLRIGVYLMPEGAKVWGMFFMLLATINIIYGSLGAIAQKDLKYFTAYSSVSHCGFVLFGVASLNLIGFKGAILQMFSHGIMTALFFALIGVVYGRTKTRFIPEMSGLSKVMPYIATCFFIGGFASLGLPGLSGFIAETHIFFGGMFGNPWNNHFYTTTLACLITASIVVTAVYVLRGICQVFMGTINEKKFTYLKDATISERISLGVLVITLLLIGIFPIYSINLIEPSLISLINRLYI